MSVVPSPYIAYTHDYTGPMGINDCPSGTYEMMWVDTVDRGVIWENDGSVGSSVSLRKPLSISNEVALYLKCAAEE